ncbi:hypothetical protein GCM10009765_26200 [Fodinicola feengrottensis]|uniref:DUF5753 domain-containing protein n=1 Tax=Fodinicola feengrottensis TaxID=435914 RepID=A0ABN2GRL1_9ACTN
MVVVGKDRPRLVKVLEGRSSLSTEELEALVDFLGAQPDRRAEILLLGIDARKRSGPSPYTDLAPGSFQRLAQREALASDIWAYERGVFPAYLQSPDYVEALMDAADGIWWESSDSERAKRVAFRLERQRTVFHPERPKQVDVFFSDDTLIAEVGGPDVMRRQLRHVLTAGSRTLAAAAEATTASRFGSPPTRSAYATQRTGRPAPCTSPSAPGGTSPRP